MDAQEVFKSTFNVIINEGYSFSIDIDRYQNVLKNVFLKTGFSIDASNYMFPSNLNFNIGKTVG